jgi:hypothetical protein
MSSAFRDDLEAARSRAEALAEQNEELRAEVERLRAHEAKHEELHTDTHAVANDPELVKLAESTLEKLEHLVEEADHAPAPLPPAADSPEARLAETADPLRVRVHAPLVPADALDRATAAELASFQAQQERDAARAERDALSKALDATARTSWRLFFVGLVIGLGLGLLIAAAAR